MRRPCLFLLLSLTLSCFWSCAKAAEVLHRVGKPAAVAEFVNVAADGALLFELAGVQEKVLPTELVRWSTLPTNEDRSEILLIDGSRLVLADAWTGQSAWQISAEKVTVTTQLLGEVTLARSQVVAILTNAPKGLLPRAAFLDELAKKKTGLDGLRLKNGDQWQGKFLKIVKQEQGARQLEFAFEASSQPSLVSADHVAAIQLGNQEPTPALAIKKWSIGLRDGSLLSATELFVRAEQLCLRLSCGVEVAELDAHDVVYLRSWVAECVYLSDFTADGYKSIPYLDLPWPYYRDRNVQQGPLRVSGRTYAKGLGMHTASRLSYRLEDEKRLRQFKVFLAELAIDDLAEQGGSVVFRVYLEQEGKWQQVYASPVIRGGDAPVPIKIELKNARRLALLTSFADQGDERDYANWLDARLE